MCCMKSKQTFPFPTTFAPEKQDESEETFMPEQEFLSRKSSPVHVQEEVKKSPVPSTVVLKYAQRLSQEILDDALQQWARNNIKYYDIPYIESDSEGLDAVG